MDPRKNTARFYDTVNHPINDVPFYLERIKSVKAKNVLELGCGTGRVLVPLAKSCKKIIGIDYSQEMLETCKEKVANAGLTNARVFQEDITSLNLGKTFDLVIAPYRVLQALESDKEVQGFFETIAKHLNTTGKGIVNVFKPKMSAEEMKTNWCQPGKIINQEINMEDGSRLVYAFRQHKMDKEKLVIYPDMIYRRYVNETLVEEIIHPIKMRCYYPNEFKQLITNMGFTITGSWGGYNNKEYDVGPELVIEFKKRNA
ncbi:MAG: class I SAM-dependent methyltransferase [Ignavibacteria bacterium]|jgi:2-polyprenyl-3-methyl-5-hydroxy-6-metoxy-1,4-benzoquinol methylase